MNKQPIHIVTGDGRDMWVAAYGSEKPSFFDTYEEAANDNSRRKFQELS